ncbi:hypothetical protein D9M71_844430 [compost metagenome]
MEAPSPAGIYTGSGPGAASNDSTTKSGGGGIVINQIEDKRRAGQSQVREEDGQKFIDLWIYKLHNDEDVHDALSSKYALVTAGK